MKRKLLMVCVVVAITAASSLGGPGIPHPLYVNVQNGSGVSPVSGDLTFEAWLTNDTGSVLTESSTGCFYSVPPGCAVECGNFATAWAAGDVVHVEVTQTSTGYVGTGEFTLTNDNYQIFSGAAGIIIAPAVYVDVWVDDDYTAATVGWDVTHFDNITDAVSAVADGGTVNVAAGTYSGRYNIAKSVSIIGAGIGSTIIDSTTGSSYGLYVTADDVSLEGFTYYGPGDNYGIKPSGVTGFSITDVLIDGGKKTGLDLNGVTDANITNVESRNITSGFGISMCDCHDITLDSVTTSSCGWGDVAVYTWGRFYTLGTSGIVFTGTNNIENFIQLEEGDYNNPGFAPAGDAVITYSTDILDGADVTVQLGEFGYAIHGTQDDAPGQVRVFFVETLADATLITANMPFSHFTGVDVFIEDLSGCNTIVAPGCSIQAAVDATPAGCTVNVLSGTYVENVVVDHELSLIGADKADTIIDGNGLGTVVTVTANDVTVSGFTVQNTGFAGEHAGIGLMGVTGCTVIGNNLTNNVSGVAVAGASSNLIRKNTSSGNYYGIAIVGIDIAGTVYFSTDNSVVGNTVTGNMAEGIYLDERCDENILKNNAVTSNGGNGIYCWKSGTNTMVGNTVSDNVSHGIQLMASQNNIIKANDIVNNDTGLLIRSGNINYGSGWVELKSTGNEINYNAIVGNTAGIDNTDPNLTVDAQKNWWDTALADEIALLVSSDVDTSDYLLTGMNRMAFAAARLASVQNLDGGWDWSVPDDGDPCNTSPVNTIGPIAIGIVKAYEATRDESLLEVLEDVGDLLLTKTTNFSPADGYLAVELDGVFGGSAYLDHVNANFYGPLEAGTYDKSNGGVLYDTNSYVTLVRDARANSGIGNLACWDISMGAIAAQMAGIPSGEVDIWMDGVKAEIDELDGSGYYDVIGLAGGVYALAVTGQDYNPVAGEHVAASNIGDLADILVGYQLSAGGFTWNAGYAIDDDDNESTQETAYAVLALAELGGYTQAVEEAVVWLKSVQNKFGGFNGWEYGSENNEVSAEALWAIGPWNLLELNVASPSLYVQPGENVISDMDVKNLIQKITGCQAMLGYSSTYLQASAGCVVAGGSPWDELIYNSWDVSMGVAGEIDTAIGIEAGSISTGTDADNTVAIISLEALAEGITEIIFRADDLGDETAQTILSDMTDSAVWPEKIYSQTIVIDGTDPLLSIDSAAQGAELLGGTPNALQGVVTITVTTSDALAGLTGAPVVTVTPNGGSAEAATLVGEVAGTYTYTWDVTALTPNGAAVIDASSEDLAGNIATDSGTINVNKTQITGTVSTMTYSSAAYSVDRDVVLTATDAGGAVLDTWTVSVSFVNDTVSKIASGSYTLTDVPAGTASLSAKTAWTLREKQAVAFDGDMQAVNDFTILGGDLNDSNAINILDYSTIKRNWGTSVDDADINGDGSVNVFDLVTLKANFFKTGDAE